MTSTQRDILGCLEANVGAAETQAMRRFAQAELDSYCACLMRAREDATRRSRRPGPAWDREIELKNAQGMGRRDGRPPQGDG